MEKKYINESRYKKRTAKKRRDSHTVRSNMNFKKQTRVKEDKKVKHNTKINKKIKKTYKKNKLSNIIICIILLIIIGVISRAILKDENAPFLPLHFFEQKNDEIITIGIISEESLLDENNKNIVVNELKKYSKDMLLQVNEDYTITYKCISEVIKVSNTEYILKRNLESNVMAENIKLNLDRYRKNELSVYYNKLQNIDIITVVDSNTLNIKLKSPSPYFIYNLDICLNTASDLTNYVQDSTSSSECLVFNRHQDAESTLPSKVIAIKYKDMYSAVQAYKDKKIKVFATNAENVTNILGKYEYNITEYRNGQSVFLFVNPASEVISRDEVRKTLAYSIDRDIIIKDVVQSKGQKIDLPYIYDEVRYKYDVYAAENLLLTSGYKKSNKIYSKVEKGVKTSLELSLIVNKQDDKKVSIANIIKNNLGAMGIKVNIEKLTQAQIKNRIQKGTYDLILANVTLNNTPDISFVSNNMYMTDNIKQAINNVSNSTVQDLNENINALQATLSEQIATIGIYSDVSYIIYSKDVIGIEQVSYMHLFKGLLN